MAYKPFLRHKLHIQLYPYNKLIYKQLHPLNNIFHILEPKVEHPLHRACIEHRHWHNQHWQCHLHRRLLDIFGTFLLNSSTCWKEQEIFELFSCLFGFQQCQIELTFYRVRVSSSFKLSSLSMHQARLLLEYFEFWLSNTSISGFFKLEFSQV